MSNHPDAKTLIPDRYPGSLAELASCSAPDTDESPGAKFLASVLDSTRDALDYALDSGADDVSEVGSVIDKMHDDSTIHEIADNAPDVYTTTRWAEFTDLGAYFEDVSELGGVEPGSDMTNSVAGVALYMIAERLVRALLDEAKDKADELAEDRDADIADAERHYAELIEQSPDGAAIIDQATRNPDVYNVAIIREAFACGWLDNEAAELLERLDSDDAEDDPDLPQMLHDTANDAESWLTETIAPEGYVFYSDGERGAFVLDRITDGEDIVREATDSPVVRPVCVRCGADLHYDERVWLDDGDGEGCTDDEGAEGVHKPTEVPA